MANILASNYYQTTVKPIFDNRCIACHACNESPCQLKLTSYEGVMRGAHPSSVYESRIFKPLELHRLGKDAKTIAEWRKKGFWSVIENSEEASSGEAVDNSLLSNFIMLGQKNNSKTGFSVPTRRESETCVDKKVDFNKHITENKLGSYGMPFGFPALSNKEIKNIQTWIALGAKNDHVNTIDLSNLKRIKQFEDFLNGQDLKSKWTAKYIYEHLYLAHFSFPDSKKQDEFFELIRSKTPAPLKIDEAITNRPYEDPKVKIYYRLRKITSTIVLKTHLVLNLSDAYLVRLKKQFLEAEWNKERMVEVNYKTGNPFINFTPIPAVIRYQFLLDNAKLMIDFFTRGPVCNGGMATYAVRDHFWAIFLDPKADPSVQDEKYFDEASKYLIMPHDRGDEDNFLRFRRKLKKFEKLHAKKISEFHETGLSATDIWDGEKTNPSAILTIFRHGKSTSVHYGRHGSMPNTKWVVDYPIFERIYYLLVAGFDVYGTTRHKLDTRRYMEQLRRESEDLYLAFLPKDKRIEVRKRWYTKRPGQGIVISNSMRKTYYLEKINSENSYKGTERTDDEFINRVTKNIFTKKVTGKIDSLNVEPDTLAAGDELTNILRLITKKATPFAKFFKDTNYLEIRMPNQKNKYFGILANKFHSRMNIMLNEAATRYPEKDYLSLHKTLRFSHINQIFSISFEQLGMFVKDIQKITTEEGYNSLVMKYGVVRNQMDFWSFYDRIVAHYKKLSPIESGVLDLNRYVD